jgi:hypothetical protein
MDSYWTDLKSILEEYAWPSLQYILNFALGLLAGIAIYWLPLKQFKNEIRALWNLVRRRYKQGDLLKVKPGTEFRPLNSSQSSVLSMQGTTVRVWHDQGVDWIHTSSGWIRARVIHVGLHSGPQMSPVYRVCHLDLEL